AKATDVDDEALEPDELDDEVEDIDLPAKRSFGQLKIAARLAAVKNGVLRENYPSGGRSLAKNMWLRFQLEQTNVSGPYSIHWIVQNSGREAKLANALTHANHNGTNVQWESTRYRGSHVMICELRRDKLILARTKHVVNIK